VSSNIRFLPMGIGNSNIPFKISAVTSHADDHDKELMADLQLDTYWEASSSGQQDIDIDLGANFANYTIDHVFIYAKITNADYAPIIIYSDTHSDYSAQQNRSGVEEFVNGESGVWSAIYIPIPYPIATDRYWRIRLAAASAAPQIAMIFIGVSKTITCRPNYGGKNNQNTFRDSGYLQSASGKRYGYSTNPARKVWSRIWEVLDGTNKAALEFVLNITGGPQFPLWFQDLDDTTWNFVRILNTEPIAEEFTNLLYKSDPIIIEQEL